MGRNRNATASPGGYSEHYVSPITVTATRRRGIFFFVKDLVVECHSVRRRIFFLDDGMALARSSLLYENTIYLSELVIQDDLYD